MDTATEPPETAHSTVPLGTIRRFGHSMRITLKPSLPISSHAFALALIQHGEQDRPVGTVRVTPTGDTVTDWDRGEATEISLLPGSMFERGLLDTCRALSEAIRNQTALGPRHGLRPGPACPGYLAALYEEALS